MSKKLENAVVEAVAEAEEVIEESTGQEVDLGEVEKVATGMTAAVRRVLMAGVGVVVLTKDEIEDFVTKLIERGEIAEQDGRRLVRDVLHRRRDEAEEVAEKVQEETEKQVSRAEMVLDQRIEAILSRLNVPSKSDIDLLSEKISLLADKVDALKNA